MPSLPIYLVPIANIPSSPSYTVHYYTWGTTSLSWSTSAPSPLPNMTTDFVACLVLDSSPPSGAIYMGSKDGPPPPGQFSALTDLNSFKEELEEIIKDQRAP